MPRPVVKVQVAGKDLFSKTVRLPPRRIEAVVEAGTGDSSLVAHWRMGETSGTSVADSSGSGLTGTASGATATATGRSFDGVDDYVQVSDANPLDMSGGLTISAWVNPTALNHAGGGNLSRVLEKGSAYRILVRDTGQIDFATFHSAAAQTASTSAGAVPVSSFTHIVCTYDGANQRIYVNGSLTTTRAQTGANDTNASNLFIGNNGTAPSRNWSGLISRVRLYNRAISAAEVSTIYGDIQQTRTVLVERSAEATSLVGVSIHKGGNKATQSSTLTVSNEDGNLWSEEFPARAPVTVAIDGKREFSGYVEHFGVGEGKPGTLNIECAGRTMRLRDSEVRPIVRDSTLDSDKRDSAGVVVTVSGGQITLPSDPAHSPLDDLNSVTIGGDPVLVLNLDKEGGIIYVDSQYNGEDATVNYTVFKERYEETAASDIAIDLIERHGDGTVDTSGIEAIATTLTFEPGRDSNLFTELGRIRDFLGGNYDFYLDDEDVLHFFQRDGSSVAVISKHDVRTAAFSVDYSAYANKVTVRSNDAKTNSISVDPAPFQNIIEGLTPTGTEVDIAAQGFKALDTSARSFRVLAKRDTEDDAIDWSVQYNGKRRAISETFDAAHSLTPDSTNIAIDTANDRIHVKASGAGNAYFSNEWWEDLNQDASNTTSSITTTSNIHQTVTVADLARKTVKGIAFKTATTTNSVVVKIYSGSSGNTGTLLGTSEAVPLGANDHEMETDWFAVYFNDAVDLSAQTTVSIVPNTTAGTMDWARQSTDVYAGGAASAGGDFTFQFYTAKTVEDLLAAIVTFDATVAVANKTPQYFIARDYSIGDPGSANWVEVLAGLPRLFPASSTADKFGIKVAFNSASIASDPLLSDIHGAVAYLDVGVAHDEWSGIVVGGLEGTITAEDLPFYNEDTGTFTKEVAMDEATRLEPDGNYWLVMSDGNQDDGGISHFTAYYDDGASATYTEDWGDETAIASSTNLDVSDSEASIDRNQKSASFLTNDLLTTANPITDGLIVSSENAAGGRIFHLLSRNRRNYYNPRRSTTTTDSAANTGEICILQFDSGDTAPIGGSGTSTVTDQSGSGYNATGVETASITSGNGKYGNGITVANGRDASGRIEDISMWIDSDLSFAMWVKPTAALTNSYICYHGVATNTTAKVGIFVKATAAGQIQVGHTYGDGASTESFTTDNTSSATVLTNGVWTHLCVRRFGRGSYDVYLDGVLKNTFTIVNPPDIPGNTAAIGTADDPFVFQPRTGGASPPGALTASLDEVRLWPRVVEDWVIQHVMTYAYRSAASKFAFPAEADGTDDYTDTATAADAGKTHLRVAQFQWTAPYYEDGVVLRLPLNRDTINLNGTIVGATDVSSYAHAVTGTGTVNGSYGSGALGTDRADFGGGALYVTNSDHTHFESGFTLMGYVQQDVTGANHTIFSKAGEIRVDLFAIDASNSIMTAELTCQGGIVRNTPAFRNVPIGTANTHVAITYDGQAISLYLNGSLQAQGEFGSPLPVARTTSNLYIGAQNTPGGAATALTNPFDGKMDEVIWLNYAATAADIAAIDSDYAIGRRSPTQSGYSAAAYDGTGVAAYADGKYLVSRDEGATAVDTLDGSTSNPYGSLCFKMEFGKANVQAIRRNEAEIERVGIEVGKVFDVPATDAATLGSIAEGYLEMLSDGLAKGQIAVDGAFPHDVGDIVTVNYPEKGQPLVQYAVAAVDITVTNTDFSSRVQLGEEERSAAGLFGEGEVGI